MSCSKFADTAISMSCCFQRLWDEQPEQLWIWRRWISPVHSGIFVMLTFCNTLRGLFQLQPRYMGESRWCDSLILIRHFFYLRTRRLCHLLLSPGVFGFLATSSLEGSALRGRRGAAGGGDARSASARLWLFRFGFRLQEIHP